MKVNFEEVLKEKRDKIFPVINKYLESLSSFEDYCKVPQKYLPLSILHKQMVSEYPERKGKYLRPTLLVLTAAAMGFSESKSLLTAAAMQTSEDWILNHDDIEGNLVQDYID